MCGICGVVSSGDTVSEQTLRGMCAEMRHRGPDASDVVRFEGGAVQCGLGHVRLSIIDLAGGAQPMCNEDGTVWIVYNGEVYNHRALRRDLEAKGHIYRTNCDTETLIHLYEEYGEQAPQYLRGMFAYAIWDDNKKELHLVRDRLGIKPLYYAVTPGGFVFSSEIKTILKSGLLDGAIDRGKLAEYFTFGYLTDESTLFKNVRKLLPGHQMVCRGEGEPDSRPYWNVNYRVDLGITEVEAVERLREIFYESVRLRMMSDVPLGMFLSGGLDSSAIAGIMAKLSSRPLKAFTIGFEKKYYSEAGYAKLVAARNGLDLHEVVLTSRDFMDSIEKLIWHNDLPIHFPASVALYFISEEARRHVKVVLTGEGSDELFGGYGKYRACAYNLRLGKAFNGLVSESFRSFIRRTTWNLPVPLKLKKAVAHSFLYHSLDPRHLIFDNYYALDPRRKGTSLVAERYPDLDADPGIYRNYLRHFYRFPDADPVSRLLYTDQKTYLEELLMKQDKMSMAASIESRVPFLDHVLVEYAATLPAEMKVKNGSLKHVMKQAMTTFVPAEIIRRKKMGFPMPLATWMREPQFNDYLKDILLGETTRERGVFSQGALVALLAEHEKGRSDNAAMLWTALNFELWCRTFSPKME